MTRKILQALGIFILAALLAGTVQAREGEEKIPVSALLRKYRAELRGFSEPNFNEDQKKQVLELYNHLDPKKEIATALLEKAVLYYHWNLASLRNKKYMTIIDFGKFSGHKRFFILNMEEGSLWSTRVAHGEGSDIDDDGFAEKFLNVVGSNATSLGAYLTAETYTSPKNGLSMRLDGLSETNSKARERSVVFHGAKYVKEENAKAGRSWGCPAIAMALRSQVIAWLRDGSLIYAGKSM